MVSPDLLQAEIITLLRAHPALSSVDLHEANWQGTTVAQLKVRVGLSRQDPYGQTSCQQTQSIGRWTVSVLSSDNSSKEASHFIGVAVAALVGKQLNTTGFYSFTIKNRGVSGPHRAPTEEWRSDAFFEARLFNRSFAFVV